ncbi:hypothetical protein [Neorhizobium sp. DAR64861/K0K2]|uniref:hypothetical protein n=1 Tax=unclassified Neorhizobium TaxID=2629175 RepID=UPI003D2D93D0
MAEMKVTLTVDSEPLRSVLREAEDALSGAARDIGILLAQIDALQDATGEALEAEDAALVSLIRKTWSEVPAPQDHVRVEPDYCFDPDDWEFTCDWTDRDQVHAHGDALTRSDPMRVCTLMKGPDKWVADVPVTWDENGDPEDTEIMWFDSEAEARAALTATTEGQL